MKMLKQTKMAGRGLSQAMIMIAGVSALMMIAGSAQAQSADRSNRQNRDVSITIDGDEVALNGNGVALRAGRGVLEPAANADRRNGRSDSMGEINRPSHAGRPEIIVGSGNRPIRIDRVRIDRPVTAVPEPGAALLFGAGIVLAGLRRR